MATASGGASVFVAGLGLGLALGALAALAFVGAGEEDVARYREIRDYTRSAFVRDLSDDEILDRALHGLADHLDDYSQYYDPREVVQLERETGGRYGGLGVVMKRPFRDGLVLFPLPGGPAESAGVRVGDRIRSIAGQSFHGLEEDRFRALVVGNEERPIRLELEGRDGTVRTVDLFTGSVLEPTVKHERIVDEERHVGYLAVTSFSHETPGEFALAFERLRNRGMRGLIVDLRGNPGGVLQAAVQVARGFVREGLLVSTEGRGEAVRHAAESDAARFANTPLVLLVDDGSASASEVLAAALQEHRVAVLVGTRTYGKGMVQTLHRFPGDGAVLKLTTSYYYTPSHKNLEHSADPSLERGLAPDLFVGLTNEAKRAVHEHLAQASPLGETRARIEQWEREDGIVLLEPHPRDAQLDAAIALFAGRRPGPQPLGESP